MMIVGSLDLPVVEEMALAEIEPDPLIPLQVRHAMFLADRGIEAGPVHERDPGGGRECEDSGACLDEVIAGACVADFAGGAGDPDGTRGRKEEPGARRRGRSFPNEEEALAENAVRAPKGFSKAP